MVGFAQMMEIFESLPKDVKKAFVALMEEIEKKFDVMERMATKDELSELRAIVAELAQAQVRTEERLNELAKRVGQLTQRMDELAQAQAMTEQRLNELAEAQKKTEQRLENLAKRVDELAQRMDELAQAQKKTEETLNALIGRVKLYEQKVDGLSHSFGFLLEDRAIQSLPDVLEREGIKVIGNLRSREIEIDKLYEINIYGVVEDGGKKKVLLGECKSRASKKELSRFLKVVNKVKDYVMREEGADDVFLVFVVHRISNKLREEFEKLSIRVYESYLLRI